MQRFLDWLREQVARRPRRRGRAPRRCRPSRRWLVLASCSSPRSAGCCPAPGTAPQQRRARARADRRRVRAPACCGDRAERGLAEEGRHEDAVVDGVPRPGAAPGRARPARRRARGHGPRGRAGPAASVPRRWRPGRPGAADLFDLVLYGDRPATAEQARACWPSTTSWWGSDERRGCRPGRRTARTGTARRCHRGRPGPACSSPSSSAAVRTPALPRPGQPRAATAPAPSRRCSTTRVSTSRSSDPPTPWRRPGRTRRTHRGRHHAGQPRDEHGQRLRASAADVPGRVAGPGPGVVEALGVDAGRRLRRR